MADKYDTNVKRLEKSLIEVSINIPEGELKKEIEKTYQRLAPKVKIEGFREGKAPKEMILQKLGPALYEETLNHLLPNATVETLEKEGLTPVDQVKYDIEEFEADKGLKFKATFTVYPEIEIGNLKKVKVKKEKVEIKEEEVEKVLSEMFEDWKKREEAKVGNVTQNEVKGDSTHPVQAQRDTGSKKVDEEEEGLPAQERIEKAAEKGKKPEVILKYSEPTDKWAKEETNLDVENLEELREKVRAEVKRHKESMAEAEYQNKVMGEAIKLSKMEVPDTFVERELDRRMQQYKQRIASFGLKFEDFLRAQKTDEQTLRDGWRDNANAFIESELLLMQFAKDEALEITDEEIQAQIDQVQDAKTKEQLDNPNGRAYIETVLLRQKAFKRLLEVVESK